MERSAARGDWRNCSAPGSRMMSGSAKRLYRNGCTSSRVSGPPRLRSRTPTTSSFSSTALVPQSVMDGSDTARAATDDRGLARPRLVPNLCEPRKPFEGEWSPSGSRGAHPARSTRAPDPTPLVAATRLDDVPIALRSPLIIAGDAPIAARTASAIAPTVDYFPRDTRAARRVRLPQKAARRVPDAASGARPSWVWMEFTPPCVPRVPIGEKRGPNTARAFTPVAARVASTRCRRQILSSRNFM